MEHHHTASASVLHLVGLEKEMKKQQEYYAFSPYVWSILHFL